MMFEWFENPNAEIHSEFSLEKTFERLVKPQQPNYKVLKANKIKNAGLYRLRKDIRRDSEDWFPVQTELVETVLGSGVKKYWATRYRCTVEDGIHKDCAITVGRIEGREVIKYIRDDVVANHSIF